MIQTHQRFLMATLMLVTVSLHQVESQKLKHGAGLMAGLFPSYFYDLDLDIEEPGELQELLQDRWELGIQQDICPW